MFSVEEWQKISNIARFLEIPRSLMEQLSADLFPTLDLVCTAFSCLMCHCKGTATIPTPDGVDTDSMKIKLVSYKSKLIQEPALIAGYLNPTMKANSSS